MSNQGLKAFLSKAEYELAASYLEQLSPRLMAVMSGHGPLTEAGRYMVSAGGRRLRPLVTLAVSECLGGRIADALPSAVAVELIHTASLIHDDMLDGSNTRRGQPAVHVKFGPRVALLAGDMLFFVAMDSISGLPQAVTVLNDACRAMCMGEIVEEEAKAARLKGGSLFAAAAELGALAAGAEPAVLKATRRYGERLGTVYQIRDNQIDMDGRGYSGDMSINLPDGLDDTPPGTAKSILIRLAAFASKRLT